MRLPFNSLIQRLIPLRLAMPSFTAVLCVLLHCTVFYRGSQAYEPSWDSLDTRPIPEWFEDAKFGIFCHWGVYAVPSFSTEWFWYQWQGPEPSPSVVAYMKKNFPPRFTYADFAPMFTTEFFDPDRFANIVKSSGAKYFVLTSKHVEGYTMWPSNFSWNWNSQDVGPNRDLVGEIHTALKKVGGVRFGLYYCLYEWFNRQYLNDKANQFTTDDYVREVVLAQLTEIVNNYKPDLIWGDGEYEAPDTYWRSTNFLAWLYNESPVKTDVVVNDRWGKGIPGHHGGYLTFWDHFDPQHLVARKWESCIELDYNSWGFRRPMESVDVMPVKEVLAWLARTIACNGNLLLNAGPTHDGRYVPIFEERFKQIGKWLATNGEAVYKSKPWIYQNDSNIWYTSQVRIRRHLMHNRVFNPQDTKNTIVYAFVSDWPHDGQLILPSVNLTSKSVASMLGYGKLPQIGHLHGAAGGAVINLSAINWRDLPSYDLWVIKLEYLASEYRDPVQNLIERGILDSNGLPTSRNGENRQFGPPLH